MSSFSVNGLSQFVANYKSLEQFGLKEDGTGKRGFRELKEFLRTESLENMNTYAQQMFDQKNMSITDSLELHKNLIARIGEFGGALPHDQSADSSSGDSDISAKAQEVLKLLKGNVEKLRDDAHTSSARILLVPGEGTFSTSPEALPALFSAIVECTGDKHQLFHQLTEIIVKMDTKKVDRIFFDYFVSNVGRAQEWGRILNEYDSYVNAKAVDNRFYNGYQSKIGQWIGPACGLVATAKVVQEYSVVTEDKLKQQALVDGSVKLSEVEADDEDFMKLEVMENKELLEKIISAGPDGTATERRTGRFRSLLNQNPYRIQHGYEQLKEFIAKATDMEFMTLFNTDITDHEKFKDTIKRFGDVFASVEPDSLIKKQGLARIACLLPW